MEGTEKPRSCMHLHQLLNRAIMWLLGKLYVDACQDWRVTHLPEGQVDAQVAGMTTSPCALQGSRSHQSQ